MKLFRILKAALVFEGDNSSLCKTCGAVCCQYMGIELTPPETKKEADDLRWFIAHKDVSVYVDDGVWTLHVKNSCEYLDKDNKCTIYDKRPNICRDYKAGDLCEYKAPVIHDLEFNSVEDLDDYVAKNSKDFGNGS